MTGLDPHVREGLGRNLRELRTMQGLTLATLAAQVGVSPSAISQIERGATEPSLGTLWKLGTALNASLFDFFTHEEQPTVELTRADDRTIVAFDRFRYEVVARSSDRLLDLFFLRIEPGHEAVREPTGHSGEECGVVLEGALDVLVADQSYRLHQGDGIWFVSAQPHTFRPVGDTGSLSVWADTIPELSRRTAIEHFLRPEIVESMSPSRP